MPIKISIKSPYVSGLNVYDAITAAFADAEYPIKVSENTQLMPALMPTFANK